MSEHVPKSNIFIPFDLLPEGKNWAVGQAYRVKMVIRQVSIAEEGSDFEIIDATSLEPADKSRKVFLSEGGMMRG